jgi:hypothetical protein
MIEDVLSGFLFLFIIITNMASNRFGYETFSSLDSDTKLKKINKDQKKFKIGTTLILLEHIGIISLAIMLFLTFNSYSLLLAVVWTISRITEGLIQIINKKSYWNLVNISKQYAEANGTEKKSLSDLTYKILKTKNSVFTFAQILFSVGTLSYSILFVTSGIVPELVGWFGIVASIIYGFGSGIKLAKTNIKAVWSIGGLLILIFELILGVWLMLSPII